MRKWIWISAFLACTSVAQAQFLDTLLYSFKLTPQPTFDFSMRNGLITAEFAKTRTIFAGLNYGDITRVGLTYNWIAGSYQRDDLIANGNEVVEVEKTLRMHYLAPYIEYAFFRRKHWEATIPLQLGFGKSFFRYELDGQRVRSEEDWIIPYEAAVTIQYRFLKYFAVGGGAGFRLMIKENRYTGERLTGPLYMLRFKIFFQDVYNDYTPPTPKS